MMINIFNVQKSNVMVIKILNVEKSQIIININIVELNANHSAQSVDRKGTCHQYKPGYQNVDGKCLRIYGDKIVIDDEQCDDGNLIYNDGCHQCQFTCDDGCAHCIQGQSYKCFNDFAFLQDQNKNICIRNKDLKIAFKEQNTFLHQYQIIQKQLGILAIQQATLKNQVAKIQISQGQINLLNKYTIWQMQLLLLSFQNRFQVLESEEYFQQIINYKLISYTKKLDFSHQCDPDNQQTTLSYEIGIQRELERKQQLIVKNEYQRILFISFNEDI